MASGGTRLHSAPRTRAVRVLWLLEERGRPYELVRGESLGLLDERFPALRAHLARRAERPALRQVLAEP